MTSAKCIIILSEKSSGSSACQNILAKFADIKHVAKTRHYENETLYWTKAASVLDLPQIKMIDSEVPIPTAQARAEILALLQGNVPGYVPPADDRELIFGGWRSLCMSHAPIFVEKSPHHLCQWRVLELIDECRRKTPDIDFLFIGLIRNPLDTLYSQFQRWRSRPEQLQYQWFTAYRNLLRFRDLVGDKLVILRYEDMVTTQQSLQPVFDFCGVRSEEAARDYFHRNSLQKWREDGRFGFSLAEEVVELAKQFGYRDEELRNRNKPGWPLYREMRRAGYQSARMLLGLLPSATAGRLKALLKRK